MSSDIGNGSSMHERLKAKCLQKFKFDFDLTECYYLLVAVFKLETSGIPSCSSADQSGMCFLLTFICMIFYLIFKTHHIVFK